jgi:protein-histidine N-methyltransferase
LNTVLTVQEPSSSANNVEDEIEDEESEEEKDSEDEEDEDEKRIEEDVDTCDAEAEIPTNKIPDMLKLVNERTRAFVGDWSSLPVSFTKKGENKIYSNIINLGTIEC